MSAPSLAKKRYDYINGLFQNGWDYSLTDWDLFDYGLLHNIVTIRKTANWDKRTINDIVIMADTETSKKHPTQYEILKNGTKKAITQPNHIVCWTITLRAYGFNIVTLRGRKPSDLAKCFSRIHDALPGDVTYVFFHNLAYDWEFIERFMFAQMGFPEKQLNTKPHYPIQIEFPGSFILRDSLILLQRKLEKAAQDLGVQHQKAVGTWDYEKIRDQSTPLTNEQWHYAEFDTLSGAECIEAYMQGLQKNLAFLPLTATGIPRGDLRNIAKENRWHDKYQKMVLPYELYVILSEYVSHGGYTHGNRHFIDFLIKELVRCYDIASSYPFILTAFKFPMGAFKEMPYVKYTDIMDNMDDYAFFFKAIMIKPQLKRDEMPMPYLQFSKCTHTINAVMDNGRIISAEYAEIWLTEYDLAIILDQYKFAKDGLQIVSCYMSAKAYLPRWFTDYVFSKFEAKTRLKHKDKVLYTLAKGTANSLFGMTMQRVIKDNIEENYQSLEPNERYATAPVEDPKAQYEKEIAKSTSFLPFQWSCWVTSAAAYRLFELGKCVKTWYYSDTDSCYGSGWDPKKIEAFNNKAKEQLKANGYGPVIHEGREYWLGVAESDPDEDVYTEYKYMGAKRYAGRNKADGKVHITVAGVPKKEGAACLHDNMEEFAPGKVFDGETTGKKTHTYIPSEIYIDERGNECGNSVDLTLCDYELDRVDVEDWDDILYDEIEVIDYEA